GIVELDVGRSGRIDHLEDARVNTLDDLAQSCRVLLRGRSPKTLRLLCTPAIVIHQTHEPESVQDPRCVSLRDADLRETVERNWLGQAPLTNTTQHIQEGRRRSVRHVFVWEIARHCCLLNLHFPRHYTKY